ncbi:hypothetical protein JRQ81_008413 [Phrynocephalus forsythii]|uniref:Uncharacterized protein n=1 Tax=Phrynocephalus forsythii TaxID=171643 RepID=A0A9Q0XDT8_9SAUR|nr:hypothetical protein JRQ81_008413 [Phrynocephalus forsythii]
MREVPLYIWCTGKPAERHTETQTTCNTAKDTLPLSPLNDIFRTRGLKGCYLPPSGVILFTDVVACVAVSSKFPILLLWPWGPASSGECEQMPAYRCYSTSEEMEQQLTDRILCAP